MATTRTPDDVLEPLVKDDFGKILKKARESAGYATAEDFATILGVEAPRYRYWERGEAMPSVTMVVRICHYLGIEPNDLLPRALRRKMQKGSPAGSKNGRGPRDVTPPE
jgi:transcriptional regulator with XRE-family HTH domain